MTAITGSRGRVVQQRAPRKKGWDRKARTTFLDVLAATANVRTAAGAAGLTAAGGYAVRRRDPEFARLWQEALTIAVERLQDELLARAIGRGHDDVNPTGERALDETLPAFDEALAIKVVQLHHGRTGEMRARHREDVVRRVPPDQVDAAIRRKLDAILRRMETRVEAGPETGTAGK